MGKPRLGARIRELLLWAQEHPGLSSGEVVASVECGHQHITRAIAAGWLRATGRPRTNIRITGAGIEALKRRVK